MRRRDDTLDPVVERELDALDAALRGEPVGPEDTELAELALLLVAEAPRPPAELARELDERAANRFGQSEVRRAHAFMGSPSARRRFNPSTLAGVVIASVLVLGVVLAGQFAPRGKPKGGTATSLLTPSPQRDVAPSQAEGGGAAGGSTAAPQTAPTIGRAAPSPLPIPAPQPGPRRIERAASLTLVAAPRAIDRVSRQIGAVTRSEGGIVASSNVTTGRYGGGRFQLRIPSSRLQDALARLAAIPGARVQASSNSTLDITGSFNAARHHVQELEAERAGLLKALANAVTLNETDSIKARLAIVNGRLRAAHARLDSVRTRAAYSTVAVELITRQVRVVPQHHGGGGGFTLGRAWHDALRILSVSAAVLLVSLAALLPIALILLLAWWARRTAARRRREQALDAV